MKYLFPFIALIIATQHANLQIDNSLLWEIRGNGLELLSYLY